MKSPQMHPWLQPLTLLFPSTGAGSAQVQEHLGLCLPDHEIRRAPCVSTADGMGGAGEKDGQGQGVLRAPSPTDPPLSLAGFTRAQCLAWAVSASMWPSSSSSTMRWSSSSTRCGKRTEGAGPGGPHLPHPVGMQLESRDQPHWGQVCPTHTPSPQTRPPLCLVTGSGAG